jgi:hypothetical protein
MLSIRHTTILAGRISKVKAKVMHLEGILKSGRVVDYQLAGRQLTARRRVARGVVEANAAVLGCSAVRKGDHGCEGKDIFSPVSTQFV